MTGALQLPTQVICTRDRREVLLATLARVRDHAQRAPVLVVDDGSADGTSAAVAARFPGVDVLSLAQSRGAAARNVGVHAARTELVAFSDDDSWWAPGALERAAAIFAGRPRLALLAARVLVGPAASLDPVCAAIERSPELPVLGFVACGAVVRCDAFLQVGGFELRYGIGGEEQRLVLDLLAAGHETGYDPRVVAHHHPPPGARPGREATMLRNDLWTAWTRRPGRAAIGETASLLRRSARRPRVVLSAGARALAGLPWVLRDRRPLPAAVERQLREAGRSSRRQH
jgi:glycosyltransferase involved in cell wall biosynthesis